MVEKNQDEEVNNKPVDKILVGSVIVLVSVGLLMILSASSIRAIHEHNDAYYYFRRQTIFALAGTAIMFIFSRVDYRIYLKYSRRLVLTALGLLILVLIPGVGRTAHGARRWLDLGLFDFQPSELAKLVSIIYISSFIYRKNNRIKSFFMGILPPMIVVTAIFLLVAYQPDLGTGITIFAAAITLLIIGGMRFRHLLLIALPGNAFLIFYITRASYRLERIMTFIDPWRDPQGAGYHIIQSLMALGAGGITGVGPGGSRQKFLYLPEPGTDFIYAILGEELGFIGAAIVLILFLIIGWRGALISRRAPDLFGSMLAAGITVMICLQAIINIGAVTSLLPVTGITLPFISYGGSSLLIMLVSVGILLNVSRNCSGRSEKI